MNDSDFGPISIQRIDGISFAITVEDVPEDACNQLKEKKWINVEWLSPSTCTDGDNSIKFQAY
jgi:hypothetical protein